MTGNNTPQQIARFAEVAEEVARAAGGIALGGFRGKMEIKAKGPKDIVTQFDTAAERAAIAIIKSHFPDHDILGEESGASAASHTASPYMWVIDPIDGTHNYAAQLPFWCTSIAVMDAQSGTMLAAAINDPVHLETFTASAGGGAFLNGEPIHVSGVTELSEAFLSTDIGYGPGIAQRMTSLAPWVERHVRRFRLMGSAVLAMAYVAAGRFDGYYHLSLQPWDIAAVSLLVKEAGGVVTDWEGKPLLLQQTGAVASPPAIHGALLQMLREGDARLREGKGS